MYTLKLKHHFDASHHLENYEGVCANNHGHRWEVEVEIQVNSLDNDMVVDFKELKSIINKLDHCDINEKVDFNPTAENLACHLFRKIKEKTGLRSKITLWESPEASITYTI